MRFADPDIIDTTDLYHKLKIKVHDQLNQFLDGSEFNKNYWSIHAIKTPIKKPLPEWQMRRRVVLMKRARLSELKNIQWSKPRRREDKTNPPK